MWFAAVLLVLLLVAMACATVFESAHGAEHALAAFYHTWWFETLLALVAVNVTAAMIVRFPFSNRHIGFLVTHLSILTIFAGALVTKHYGIDGRVGIVEGETVDSFSVLDRPTLTVAPRHGPPSTVLLDGSIFNGFKAVTDPEAPELTMGDVRADILAYLPDSQPGRRMVNDNPRERTAIKMSLSESGLDDAKWVFADEVARWQAASAVFRTVSTAEELETLLNEVPAEPSSASKGSVKIEYEGATFERAIEECMDKPVAVGETGYTVRVKRYLPHAKVGPGGIENASPQPHNPYIDVELAGPDGIEQRHGFARFPEMGSVHGGTGNEAVKLTFIASGAAAAPRAQIEVLSGPDGVMHLRFNLQTGTERIDKKLGVGESVKTPWSNLRFSVLQRYDQARWEDEIEPVDPVRKDARMPAVHVRLSKGDESTEIWVQKHMPRSMMLGGIPLNIQFTSQTMPLGFKIKLDRFHLGMYPGTRRKRSFESVIRIIDPRVGGEQNRVISMNRPTTHQGYTFFQERYDDRNPKAVATILSVSRDPGKLIVFAGYIFMAIGMVWVFIQRARGRRSALSTMVGDDGPA